MSVFIVFMLIFAGCSLSVVDIQDYITIEYSSQYNGYATPELIVDDNETNSMMDRKLY